MWTQSYSRVPLCFSFLLCVQFLCTTRLFINTSFKNFLFVVSFLFLLINFPFFKVFSLFKYLLCLHGYSHFSSLHGFQRVSQHRLRHFLLVYYVPHTHWTRDCDAVGVGSLVCPGRSLWPALCGPSPPKGSSQHSAVSSPCFSFWAAHSVRCLFTCFQGLI